MENNGLYGQNERGSYFADRADANRIEDIDAEGCKVYEGVPTEAEYRRRMGACILDEIKAARQERQLETWYKGTRNRNVLPEILLRSIDLTVEQQRQALQRLAVIAEAMKADDYSHTLVFNALTAATPIAYHLLSLERRTQSANKPQAKSRRAAEAYSPALAAKYGGRR